MNVDEAGCEDEPGAGDTLECVAVGEVPDGDDPAVGDGDVGGKGCATVSVVDEWVFEDRPEQRLT